MAGVVGFEPTNGGFKGPCLTTWLHPKIIDHRVRSFVRRLADQDDSDKTLIITCLLYNISGNLKSPTATFIFRISLSLFNYNKCWWAWSGDVTHLDSGVTGVQPSSGPPKFDKTLKSLYYNTTVKMGLEKVIRLRLQKKSCT